jgi:SHAQKYF class myb-like DNA-binding protein
MTSKRNYPSSSMQSLQKNVIFKDKIQTKKVQEFAKNKNNKTQSRYWTKVEHELFLEALEKFGQKDVKSISAFVGTRTPTQVRTHAQKYFLRLKRGTNQRTFLEDNLYKPVQKRDCSDDNSSPKNEFRTTIIASPLSPDTIDITRKTTSLMGNNTQVTILSPVSSDPTSNTFTPVKDELINDIEQNPAIRRKTEHVTVQSIGSRSSALEIPKPCGIIKSKLTREDISKLGYAMKVYKHLKDYSTKINCIQRHFFPGISTEELHLFLTEFFSDNPHAIHADFYLLPPSLYPWGNDGDYLYSPTDSESREENERDTEDDYDNESYMDDINNDKYISVSPLSLFYQDTDLPNTENKKRLKEFSENEDLEILSITTPYKRSKQLIIY